MRRKSWRWVWLVFGLLAVAGLFRLRFDVDVLNLLPGNLPAVEGLKLYQRNFTDSRELIVTVRNSDAEKCEAAARALAGALRAESNLVDSVMWQPMWQEHPARAAELIGYLWLNQPPTEFNKLAKRLAETNLATILTEKRERLATAMSPMEIGLGPYDPYDVMSLPESVTSVASASFGQGQSLFASGDGTFRIMFVKAKPEIANYRGCIAWLKEIKGVAQAARAKGGVLADTMLGFTGGPAFVAEISGGMEHDMTASIGITSAIIAILFWIFHRRWLPMLWLLTLLAVILACTLALGGLLFGAINVVSLGFAGILLGLAVDYGVVHYQEAQASPNAIIPEIRRAIGPSIFWAAVTTISAFLALNLGGLPGLAQLGSLVALGVALSAVVMLFAFLPPLFRDRVRKREERERGEIRTVAENSEGLGKPLKRPEMLTAASTGLKPGVNEKSEIAEDAGAQDASCLRRRLVFAGTIVTGVVAVLVLASGTPRMDQSADALRPRHSPAYTALDEMKAHLVDNREPLWLITSGKDELEVARHLEAAAPVLERAVTGGIIASFTMPTALWPRPDYQAANRAAARQLVAASEKLHSAALQNGFATNSLVLTDAILDTWRSALEHKGTFWPTNEMSRWIMGKIAAHPDGEFLALVPIFGSPGKPMSAAALEGLSQELAPHQFIMSGWELLGSAILKRVEQNMWKVLLPMVTLVLLSLFLAFRRPTEILLSLAVLGLSGMWLLAAMRLAGWSWNLLNLMALPLMLGSGVDYSIFMQLALRRHRGNLAAAQESVGRALLLCGGTAVAGFGSLSLSTNAGMASLGEVCAIGIGSNMVISVLLLPVWWRAIAGSAVAEMQAASPSSFYRSDLWRLGMRITTHLPRRMCVGLCHALAKVYWALAAHRREIVVQNLMPALNGDRAAAERKGSELMQQFALKLADLWRYESGRNVDHQFGEWTGWEHFETAQRTKRGILLLTPHLGNWEFGGPLLTKRGVNLQVITLAEPGNGFTEMRRASRAKWDIETLVVGEDPFAFVEIIRRLDAGATVAMLIDRPPAASQILVELFGRPFAVSVAAAELARASGCVLLPVYLPHTAHGYAAHILPAISYDRATLRQREARKQLTQAVVNAFEAPIREYLDQWYHFVPIWPERETEKPNRNLREEEKSANF